MKVESDLLTCAAEVELELQSVRLGTSAKIKSWQFLAAFGQPAGACCGVDGCTLTLVENTIDCYVQSHVEACRLIKTRVAQLQLHPAIVPPFKVYS